MSQPLPQCSHSNTTSGAPLCDRLVAKIHASHEVAHVTSNVAAGKLIDVGMRTSGGGGRGGDGLQVDALAAAADNPQVDDAP